nr:MAG TPA: hypothetical protein [Caudoviricetes sp.]
MDPCVICGSQVYRDDRLGGIVCRQYHPAFPTVSNFNPQPYLAVFLQVTVAAVIPFPCCLYPLE